MDNLFANNPPWLQKLVAEQKGVFGDIDRLSSQRSTDGLDQQPWLNHLDASAIGRGFTIEQVVAYAANHSHLPTVNLTVHKPRNLYGYFPKAFCEQLYAVPFNLHIPFLSVAVLEPELISIIDYNYNEWAKQNFFCIIQYFVTTPASFRQCVAQVSTLPVERVGL